MRSDSSVCTRSSASESEDEGELNSEDSGSSSTTSSEGITSEEGEVDSDVDENDLDGAHVPPKVETPWERGLRLARERLLKAKLRRQTEADLEEKKLKLTVTAPEATEEDQLAADEIGVSRVADVFWLNYYKLAVVGCTQLTGKRSLPCDIAVPSAAKLAYWRRHHGRASQRPHHRHQQSDFVRTQVRSGSQSSASSTVDSIDGRSRTSSLSSLAGSIFLAVPELAADDESDRDEHQRRRRRRRHSSGSSSSSPVGAGGGGGDSASSLSPNRRVTSPLRSQRSVGRRFAQVDAPPSAIAVTASERTRRHHRRYAGSSHSRSSSSASSSSSSSSSRPTAGAGAYSRERSRSPKRRPPSGPPHKPFANTNQVPTAAGNIWRGRRPPMAYLEPPRQNPPRAVDKSSADRAGRGEYDRSQGDSRWPLERGVRPNISPEKITLPSSEMPTKSPWEDIPNRNRATPAEAPVYRSPSRRSRASRSPANERGQPLEANLEVATAAAEKTTFITSWSQAESPSPRHNSRQDITETREGHSRALSRRLSSHQHQLPDVVPTTATSKNLRKRGPSQMRRKSRSPFGDIEIGSNQPAPASASSLYVSHAGAGRQPPDATLSQPTPFEQTVPLLAGAVNPVNPLLPLLPTQTSTIPGGGGTPPFKTAATEADGRSGGELPAASSRPGVKLTIAPRVKVPVLRPGSGLKTKQPGSRQVETPALGDDDGDGLTDRLLSSRRREPAEESRHSRHQQRLQRRRGSSSLTRRSDGADSDEANSRRRSPVRVARDTSRPVVSPLGRRRLREPLRTEEEEEEVVPKRSRLGYTAVSPGDLDSQDFQLPPMDRDGRRLREPYQDRGSFESRDNYTGDGHRRMGDGGSRSRYDDQRGNKRGMDLERDSYGPSQYRVRAVERRSDFDVSETVGAYSSSHRHHLQYEDRGRSGPSVSDNQRRYRSSNKRSAGGGGDDSPSTMGYRSYHRRDEDSPPSVTEAFDSRRRRSRAGAGGGTRVERSRSPFESSHNREDAAAAEQRLNELRKRLTVVDDAIAELRAHHTTNKTAAAAGMR
uniref:Serine/arginine repetitive matrix protein 2 n=1 Tax=Schistocephalus solidus TaxID=70667 RepID=A0A0X3QBA1_SCHSO